MSKNIPKTGKKVRPKTAVKGKRFLSQVPQAKSEARKDSRSLVLPILPKRGRRSANEKQRQDRITVGEDRP